MRTLLSLLISSSWLVSTSHGAAMQCEGVCEVPLNTDCQDALFAYEFTGDCCALKEIDGECYMITTDNCQIKPAGESDLNCDPTGTACVPNFTVYYSDSGESCPDTEFEIPGVTFPTFVPVSDAPSMVPLSDAPSNTAGPTVPHMVIGGASSDIVAGAVSEGDCFYVERMFYDDIYSNDCHELITELSYYNGGMNPEHVDSGFEREDILRVRSLYRECPDSIECRITVDGYPDQHCECAFENGLFSRGECSSPALENVFTTPGQSLTHCFECGEPTLYETEFFTIDCGDCCEHPSHGRVSECPPAILQCPDGTTVSNQNEDCVMEECPSMAQGPTMAPTFSSASSASIELIDGDVDHGDCYTVERHLETTDFEDGCTASFLKLTYYNGGVNGNYQDTGYPQVNYLMVEIEAMHDCDDPSLEDHCTITVYDNAQGIHTCNKCTFEGFKVLMEDCSNVPGEFVHGEQTVSLLFEGNGVPYSEQFFTLAYDEERCAHPALEGHLHSDAPSYVPPSDAPSGEERYMMSSYMTEDIVEGDMSQGDCYLVHRLMWDTIYSDGCTDSHIQYKYYNGGMNSNYDDTGFPEEKYIDVHLDSTHSCGDGSPNTCSMKVMQGGETITCYTCSFEDGKFTMEDCSNAPDVFSPAVQTVTLWFEYSSNYDTAFFKLVFDEEKCMHPALGGSTFPSFVPVSDAPSYAGTSSAPSFEGTSSFPSYQATDIPEACQVPPDSGLSAVGIPTYPGAEFADVLPGDPTTGTCYRIRRESGGFTQYGEVDPDYYCCNVVTRKYTYYNGGIDAHGNDSGLPQQTYSSAEITITKDCGDRGIPTVCSMLISDSFGCACDFDESTGEVTLGDCADVGAFTSLLEQVSMSPYLNEDEDFFTLTYDEERCEHPVWSSLAPSTAPPLGGTTTGEATFMVGFFSGTSNGAPTLDEVDTFLEAAVAFYTHYLGLEFPNFQSFEARLVDFSFDASAEVPVRIDFDAVATFDEGDGRRLLLSAEALLDTMKDFDYNTFIQRYVWDYGYETLFYDTQRVAFYPRSEVAPLSLTPSSSYSEAPSWSEAPSGGGPSFVPSYTLHPWSDAPSEDPPSYAPWSDAPSYAGTSSFPSFAGPSSFPSFVGTEEPPTWAPWSDAPSYAGTSSFPSFAGPSSFPSFVGTEEPPTMLPWPDTTFPTSVTWSDAPSVVGTEEPPTWAPWSDAPSYAGTSSFPSFAGPSSFPSFVGTEEPPTWGPWIDSSFPSFTPLSEAPSFIGTEEYTTFPTSATTASYTTFPTFMPIASSFRCYDESANGIVDDDKCHATDIYHCIEEWEDGCTSVAAYFEYYNQHTTPGASSRESYYFVQIYSASGCDPQLNPGQPEDGCVVDVYGDTCLECFSDGDKITLVDCSNVANVFDPPSGQIISLDGGGDAFDVIETEEMCNHPAVLFRDDSDVTRGTGSDLLDMTDTLPINVTLRYFFFTGEGKSPDNAAISLLAAETIAFYQTAFLEDATFSDIIKDIEMTDIKHTYSEDVPDEFTMTLMANIIVEKTDDPNVSSKTASEVMSGSDFNDYLRHHVRANTAKQRNIFFQVQKVRFKGVSRGPKTS